MRGDDHGYKPITMWQTQAPRGSYLPIRKLMVRFPKIDSGERECFEVRPALCFGESVVKIYHPVFPVESSL